MDKQLMSEIASYARALKNLRKRYDVLKIAEANAHADWIEYKGLNGSLKDWTDAISKSVETENAIWHLESIIRQLEQK